MKTTIEKAFDKLRSADVLAIRVKDEWIYCEADSPVLDEYLSDDSEFLLIDGIQFFSKDNNEVEIENGSFFVFISSDKRKVLVKCLRFENLS
jgi:hypothetical protein